MAKKKGNQPKVDYKPTRKEYKAMSECLKAGYKISPGFLPFEQVPWQRRSMPIILQVIKSHKAYKLIKKTFDQKYLGYWTYFYYNKIYEEKIRWKSLVPPPPVKVRKVSFPAPPPKKMAPPPPPKK